METVRLAAAGKTDREARAQEVLALNFRTFDASMFIDYIEDAKESKKEFADFLYKCFRPDMKRLLDAWLKTDPFNNTDAPPHPFRMDEYVQGEQIEAKHLDGLAEEKHEEAQKANGISDKYALLAVMFASVLFFGGIGGTVDSRLLRTLLFDFAIYNCPHSLGGDFRHSRNDPNLSGMRQDRKVWPSFRHVAIFPY